MGKIILVTGGARSGKSAYCVRRAAKYRRVVFIATAQPHDAEMRARIARHKRQRHRRWKTIEEPVALGRALRSAAAYECALIDCLTLWTSNLLCGGLARESIEKRARAVVRLLRKSRVDAFLVTNEVGMGIVPEQTLAREFRDVAGSVNQIIARSADEVVCMVCGLPVRVK
jgi:adenosylcobinamide kinase/adenosylcobinamide-phosphate guanylyltransferase